MFNWLTATLRPKTIEDPAFGTLIFMKMKDPSRSYWEGRGHFDPVGAVIEYFIHGDEAGPGPSQRAVYRRIAENYPELLESVMPLLQREYANQMVSGGVPIADAVFTLDSLSIPARDSEAMKWEMDFSCDDGDDLLFTVQMEGWRPTGKIAVMH
jgi:hypothetical protein